MKIIKMILSKTIRPPGANKPHLCPVSEAGVKRTLLEMELNLRRRASHHLR
jgi:hypothetical protein